MHMQILMSVGSLKAHAMKMQSVLTLKEAMSVSAGQDMREMDTTAQVRRCEAVHVLNILHVCL